MPLGVADPSGGQSRPAAGPPRTERPPTRRDAAEVDPIGPMAVRNRVSTRCPTASSMRRTSMVNSRCDRRPLEPRRRAETAAAEPSSSSTPSSSRRGGIGATIHHQVVGLGNPVTGMGDQVGQFAIVGKQEQPLRVGVEPPHREHLWLGWHEVDHGGSALRVGTGADDAGRFVDQIGDQPRSDRQWDSVHRDRRRLRVGTITQSGGAATHLHPSLRIHSSAARREAMPEAAMTFWRRGGSGPAGSSHSERKVSSSRSTTSAGERGPPMEARRASATPASRGRSGSCGIRPGFPVTAAAPPPRQARGAPMSAPPTRSPPPDMGDLGTCHRLPVGDHGHDLERRRRQPGGRHQNLSR